MIVMIPVNKWDSFKDKPAYKVIALAHDFIAFINFYTSQ